MSTNCNNLIKTPLVTVANIAAMASSTTHHNHTAPQKQPQHPITTTKMGSRRIFSAQFKLTVLDSYRMDADCKGNQRATARKYGIHRRQIQKWLQSETNLRSSVNNNNNNNTNSNDLQNNQNNHNGNSISNTNNNCNSHSNANKMSAMQTMNGGAALNGRTMNNLSLSVGDNVSAKQRLIHENASDTNKSILNQSTMSGSSTANFHFTKAHQQQHHQHQHQKHNTNEINAMSLDIPRHSVSVAVAPPSNARIHNNSNSNIEHSMTKTKQPTNYIDCYGTANTNDNSEYKCATNASTASTTNTSFPVSSTSTSSTLAPSFVARPIRHSSNESVVSYASQRQPLRIVSPSYLLPSSQANASNGIPMIEPSKAAVAAAAAAAAAAAVAFHPATHYPAAYHHPQSAAFHEINPMLYDSVQPTLGMIPSIRHYLSTPHDLQVAPFSSRTMPTAFENAFHLPAQNGFYDHSSAYELYHPSYLPSIAMPTAIMAERNVVPKTEIITETETKPNADELMQHHQRDASQSPIDLTVPGSQTPNDLNRSAKLRFSLPSPPVKAAYKALEIPHSEHSESEHKPWDLRCTRKRKIDDDIDEGISINGEQSKTIDKSASSPTPAKVVKLFKPYLMSSDDEDDENTGKKCAKSDEYQRDPIIWSNTFFDNNRPTTKTPFQSLIVNTQHQTHSSYWSNHGSPVSGYDSESSTFSDCNCNDSNCQTKLASPAPTDASSFSEDFTTSSTINSNIENVNAESTVSPQPTKYIVPRRHILEKWSHEDDELHQSTQFNRTEQDIILRRQHENKH